jgi:hypothetical protein
MLSLSSSSSSSLLSCFILIICYLCTVCHAASGSAGGAAMRSEHADLLQAFVDATLCVAAWCDVNALNILRTNCPIYDANNMANPAPGVKCSDSGQIRSLVAGPNAFTNRDNHTVLPPLQQMTSLRFM